MNNQSAIIFVHTPAERGRGRIYSNSNNKRLDKYGYNGIEKGEDNDDTSLLSRHSYITLRT